MRFSLKDFQEWAVDELMSKLETARHGASRRQPQAVILSSPTGSGKTVIVTAMIERILCGHDSAPGDPRAVFLWLSDSPELNAQSMYSMTKSSDLIPSDRLVMIEHPFNHDRLAPGAFISSIPRNSRQPACSPKAGTCKTKRFGRSSRKRQVRLQSRFTSSSTKPIAACATPTRARPHRRGQRTHA